MQFEIFFYFQSSVSDHLTNISQERKMDSKMLYIIVFLGWLLMGSLTAVNAVKCNLKELTTKSAWVPRSAVFSKRMLSGWPHRSCDSLARSVFPSCWVLSVIFFPSRPSPRPIGFFLHGCFVSETGACSFPFVRGLMAGLRCCANHGGIISI